MYKILSIALFLCCSFSEIHAMRIVPFVHSFAPIKDESTIQYSLTNNSDEPIAFEVSVFKRKQDKKGNDILVKDEDSFVVFPTQVIIPGHGTRSIKVKWIGNKEYEEFPLREQAFRVAFDQFHINLNKKQPKKRGASLDIRLQMLASLYMTPKNAKEEIKVISVHESRSKGSKAVDVLVKNTGTKRASTNSMKVEVPIFGKKYKLSNVINKSDRDSVVMTQEERVFTVTEANLR